MNFVNCIIAANCTIIIFNCIGMCTRFSCPPWWVYALAWPILTAIFAVGTNPWMLQ